MLGSETDKRRNAAIWACLAVVSATVRDVLCAEPSAVRLGAFFDVPDMAYPLEAGDAAGVTLWCEKRADASGNPVALLRPAGDDPPSYTPVGTNSA